MDYRDLQSPVKTGLFLHSRSCLNRAACHDLSDEYLSPLTSQIVFLKHDSSDFCLPTDNSIKVVFVHIYFVLANNLGRLSCTSKPRMRYDI